MKTVDVLLEELDIYVDELAKRCGLEAERVGAIVDGRWLPSPHERAAIAAVLAMPPEEISWGHTMSPRNVRYHRFGLREDFKRGE